MPPTTVEIRLEDVLIKMENRLERIENELTDLKVNQSRMEEKLDAIDTSLSELKKQTDKQDNRLWLLISGMFLALLGILAKFALNP